MNRILVVEDDPSVQKILKLLFAAEGFTVEGWMDGQAGLNSFRSDAPSRRYFGSASAQVIRATSVQRNESGGTFHPYYYSHRLVRS
jgi:CheY-like chemotaxis protein